MFYLDILINQSEIIIQYLDQIIGNRYEISKQYYNIINSIIDGYTNYYGLVLTILHD